VETTGHYDVQSGHPCAASATDVKIQVVIFTALFFYFLFYYFKLYWGRIYWGEDLPDWERAKFVFKVGTKSRGGGVVR